MKTERFLSIAEAAGRSGLSPDTLRYYDRLGLLPGLSRRSGRRAFTERDLAVLSLAACLRDTGMPLKSIRDFMQASGADLADTRLAILRNHLADMNTIEAMTFLKEKMERTRNNEEFLASMNG